jgi:signal transduction histidine kinase
VLGRVIGYAMARSSEAAERRRLEQEVLEISERERQRIAHDLHDDLGQQLTGIAMLARSLAAKLSARGLPEAADAVVLGELVQSTIAQSVALARGLDPLSVCDEELPAALDVLAQEAERRFRIHCEVGSRGTVPRVSGTTAAHLYRIAQEALTNAVKHGRARRVDIDLRGDGGALELCVSDDGRGLPDPEQLERGQGLRIMEYRARSIGASLAVERNPNGSGTRVRCLLPRVGQQAGPRATRTSLRPVN